jgi:hypothetical protein
MLSGLVIYGKRLAIERVIWDIRDVLPGFERLEQLSLGTSGPRVHLPEENRVPSSSQLLQCYASVLGALPQLHDLYFIGLGLRHKLHGLLRDIQRPLTKLCLHGCDLSREDIECFIDTKHCSTELSELGLQFNKLSGMAGDVCEIVLRSNLVKLDLRETMLSFEEKIQIMSALCTAPHLETLCMYENEDMLSVAEYQHIIELACAISNLSKFFIFPFNFKPFEILVRKKLEPACEEILSLNGRSDMILQY